MKKKHQYGDLFKNLRKEKGWTLSHLSGEMDKAGKKVSPQYLGQIEGGDFPSREVLNILLNVLDYPIDKQGELFELLDKNITEIFDTPKLAKTEIENIVTKEIKELWIVSSRPAEIFNEEIFKIMVKILNEKDTKFVYWMPERFVVRFWSLFRLYKEDVKKDVNLERKIIIKGQKRGII